MEDDETAGRDQERADRGLETPPDPEALFNEGLALYRHRRWHEARERFALLKKVQPDRRGLDALLREVDIFIQLESVQPDVTVDNVEDLVPIPDEGPEEGAAEQPLAAVGPKWWVVLLVVIIVVGGAALIVLLGRKQQSAELYNRCASNTVAGQWGRAAEACCKLAGLAPDDREATFRCEKAKEQVYLQAQNLIRSDQIDQAIAELKTLYSVDEQYKDVGLLLACLDTLGSARQTLNAGQCAEAATALEKLRALNPDCLASDVSEDLYRAYACQGTQLIAQAGEAIVPAPAGAPGYALSPRVMITVSEAAAAWGRALKEKPASEQTQRSRDLAARLLVGLQSYSQGAWAECIPPLVEVTGREPGYLGGKAALLLCDARLRLASDDYNKGDYLGALRACQANLDGPGCAPGPAQTCVQQAGLRLTPTVRPTATSTATPTPTATLTARPTATVAPTNTPSPAPSPTTKPPPPPPPPPPPTVGEPPPR